jgi:ketosteroid isomerase-like protein
MASANEELVRRGFGAFSRGELDESLSTMAPDVEWHIAFRLPDLPPGMTIVRGHDQVRQLWAAFRSAWQQITVEIEEMLHDADDILIGRVRFVGRGAGSGIEVDRTLFYVLDLRDELLARIRPFDDLDEARRAAGLDA